MNKNECDAVFFGVIVWILAFLRVIQLYYIQWRLQDFILGGSTLML